MMKRTTTPWMPADEFGASLQGIGLNLLVTEIEPMTLFARSVLKATILYQDPDFAVFSTSGGQFILHADHTYQNHPFSASVDGLEARGGGIEIRLYNLDPDTCESKAREHGYPVLDACSNKPHGLREVFLLDPEGYCWVISKALPVES